MTKAKTSRVPGSGLHLVLACVLAMLACESPRKFSKHGDRRLKEGTLIFSDDFERKSLGPDWIVNDTEHWRITDGWVHGQDAMNKGLWLNHDLPRKARIEFDARSESPEGDLKCEVFAMAPEHQGGYIIIFGGWKNTINAIARLDEHGKDRRQTSTPKVVKGQSHHFTIVRSGNQLDWFIDNKPVLSFHDSDPIRGNYFGFNNWKVPNYYDNLKIYSLE